MSDRRRTPGGHEDLWSEALWGLALLGSIALMVLAGAAFLSA